MKVEVTKHNNINSQWECSRECNEKKSNTSEKSNDNLGNEAEKDRESNNRYKVNELFIEKRRNKETQQLRRRREEKEKGKKKKEVREKKR